MKKILVPTDFSDISENALNYAVEIAQLMSAELILFHVYYIPVFAGDTAPVIYTADQLERDSLEELNSRKEFILKRHPDLHISCYCIAGLPAEQINRFAEDNHIDLIVMGTQGAGYLAERTLGSITTALIRKAACPVLAIDQHVTFKMLKKIVLASDFVETNNAKALKPLRELITYFGAQLYILKVVREEDSEPALSETIAGFNLAHSVKPFHHTFYSVHNEDVVGGINEFVKHHHMDMVVMIPRKHSLVSRIFHEPFTKEMTFHSEVPLLILHE